MPDRFATNAFGNLQLDKLALLHPKGPPRTPSGRRRTRQRDKLRVRLAVQLPRLPVRLLATLNRRLDPLHHASLANALNRPLTHAQNRCNGCVREPATRATFIRKKENAGARNRRCAAPLPRWISCNASRSFPESVPR